MLVRLISHVRGFAFAGAVLALLSSSCAKKPASGGTGTYRGVMVGSSAIGIVDVTVAEAASGPLPASGTITMGNTVVSLTGALDQSKSNLSLSSTDGYQLSGDSRPAYVDGTFSNQVSQDSGSFALFLLPPNSSPIQLYCGSFVWTNPTGTSPNLFAAAVTPVGDAFCVGPALTWPGGLDSNGNLVCEQSLGLISGNVNADGGNQWGTGVDQEGNGSWGTWTVEPCGGASADGGVGLDTATDAAEDAAEDVMLDSPTASAVDAGADSPSTGAIDAGADAGAIAVPDAGADSPTISAADSAPDSPAIAAVDADMD